MGETRDDGGRAAAAESLAPNPCQLRLGGTARNKAPRARARAARWVAISRTRGSARTGWMHARRRFCTEAEAISGAGKRTSRIPLTDTPAHVATRDHHALVGAYERTRCSVSQSVGPRSASGCCRARDPDGDNGAEADSRCRKRG